MVPLRGLSRSLKNIARPVAEYFRPSEWTSICRLNGGGNDEISIKVICNNTQEYSRARTYATKEPETLEWIRRYTRPGDVLWDVGANIGLYSLFAAKLGCRVVAIEPHLPTANKLLKNVVANDLCDRVKIVPICLMDGERFGGFFVSSFEPGTSIHRFEEGQAIGHRVILASGNSVLVQYANGIFCSTADRLVREWGFPEPDHMKIDVDGPEASVLDGMPGLLQAAHESLADLDPFPYAGKLRTVLVEVHDDDMARVVAFMKFYGFDVDDSFVETSRAREKKRAVVEGGRWFGNGNCVFVRRV